MWMLAGLTKKVIVRFDGTVGTTTTSFDFNVVFPFLHRSYHPLYSNTKMNFHTKHLFLRTEINSIRNKHRESGEKSAYPLQRKETELSGFLRFEKKQQTARSYLTKAILCAAVLCCS